MTAPLTAASAPASNLGTRSCSIPHLEVGGWDGGAAVWGATGAAGWEPSRRLGSAHPSDPGRLAPATPRPRRRPRSLRELRPGRPVPG
jgi:hypothetical protein